MSTFGQELVMRLSAASAAELDQHGKARMTFCQGRHVAVLGAAQQITFPMTRNRPVVRFCRPFPDGDGIHDLTARVSEETRVLRAAHAPLRSHVLHQLFFNTPRA